MSQTTTTKFLSNNTNYTRPSDIPGCGPDGKPLQKNVECRLWELTKSPDSQIIDSYIAESLNLASADANVYKLLGVHEQGQIVDSAGFGNPISGGAIGNFPARNAFNIYETIWKSVQRGTAAIVASAFIGYDFGVHKTNEQTRRRYSVDSARIHKRIQAIALKQSANKNERVTKARLERSLDGRKWKGVQILNLPDDDCLNHFALRDSASSAFWRIRPLNFNGGPQHSWGVKAFQLIENYLVTDESNIQDKILLENRDREYDTSTLPVKIYFDTQEVQTDLTRFGLQLTAETLFAAASFSSVVAALGRPFIIGDIVQIPSLTQFSAKMEPIEKYMEVVDTMWAAEGYTPTWQPTLQRIVLQPAFASRETQDIFGDLGNEREIDALGLLGGDDGDHPVYQDLGNVTDEIYAVAKNDLPEKGTDKSGIRKWTEEELKAADSAGVPQIRKLGQEFLNDFQATDGMPPNSEPYTEGDMYPESPKDGDYHRLTFTAIDDDLPARLHRYSGAKRKWMFIEADYRRTRNSRKPIIQEYINNPNTSIRKNTKE